jgi:hypothetical protein
LHDELKAIDYTRSHRDIVNSPTWPRVVAVASAAHREVEEWLAKRR